MTTQGGIRIFGQEASASDLHGTDGDAEDPFHGFRAARIADLQTEALRHGGGARKRKFDQLVTEATASPINKRVCRRDNDDLILTSEDSLPAPPRISPLTEEEEEHASDPAPPPAVVARPVVIAMDECLACSVSKLSVAGWNLVLLNDVVRDWIYLQLASCKYMEIWIELVQVSNTIVRLAFDNGMVVAPMTAQDWIDHFDHHTRDTVIWTAATQVKYAYLCREVGNSVVFENPNRPVQDGRVNAIDDNRLQQLLKLTKCKMDLDKTVLGYMRNVLAIGSATNKSVSDGALKYILPRLATQQPHPGH